jgi:hypothetical protein
MTCTPETTVLTFTCNCKLNVIWDTYGIISYVYVFWVVLKALWLEVENILYLHITSIKDAYCVNRADMEHNMVYHLKKTMCYLQWSNLLNQKNMSYQWQVVSNFCTCGASGKVKKMLLCNYENTYPIVGGAPVTLTSGGGCATAMWLCCVGAMGIDKDTWTKI